MFSLDEARKLLDAAGVFFDTSRNDDDEDWDEVPEQTLNLSDTFFWACADAEPVSDEEIPRVAELFYRYGVCGIYHWVAEKRGMKKVEFADVNRFIQFARNEEAIRNEEPSSSSRAYLKKSYVIGEA